ncbi:MAG: hypothetical protein KatS3mg105_3031 [Gemmatales bacterium]|nr:MAG: hypothetical protein KatS3mg105_3031 [Gemmatales bacterium]
MSHLPHFGGKDLRRNHVIMVLTAVLLSTGAAYRTPNFVVEAATPQIAQQVGQAAEYYRKQKALEWLGYEMPRWPQPCPLQVKVTFGGAGGATSFAFDRGRILSQNMTIEGSLDRLLASVLPHEITHTVFAHYFRQPVPRWADEGGSVLSEDDIERRRHDMLVRQILNTPGRAMPLRRLFSLRDYPGDVMVLYAQGYSVANFLVSARGRATFLKFVWQGMHEGWDRATQMHYGYRSVEELEQAWLDSLRNRRQPPVQMAQNRTLPPRGVPTNRQILVRQTVPPTQPTIGRPAPIVRGQMPNADQVGQQFGYARPNGNRPGYLPNTAQPTSYPMPSRVTSPVSAAADPWQPVAEDTPPSVYLGPPQPIAAPTPLGQPVPYSPPQR